MFNFVHLASENIRKEKSCHLFNVGVQVDVILSNKTQISKVEQHKVKSNCMRYFWNNIDKFGNAHQYNAKTY